MGLEKFWSLIFSAKNLHLVGPLYDGKDSQFLKSGEPIVFVDGGARWKTSGLTISVGDNDSFDGPLDVVLPVKKDYSDLQYVLGQIPAHIHTLFLHGFIGARRDHELAMYGDLHRCLSARKNPLTAILDDHTFGFSAGSWSRSVDGTFSVFVLQKTHVKIAGYVEFPLDAELEPLSSHGLSNRGQGDIKITADRPFFLFREF